MYKIGRFEINIILTLFYQSMKNEVEIIVFMIDTFKINIYKIKIKTKKPKLSELYHSTNRI